MIKMNINELQKLLDDTIKTITNNGGYINEDNKVILEKEVYFISVSGLFFDEYMGDSDWRYRKVNGDIIITEEQDKILINQIVDCDNVEDEDLIIKASKLLNSILRKKDDSFTRLYCTECAEYNNVNKSNSSISFSEESRQRWNLNFYISKKLLSFIEEFNIEEKFGCV